MAASFYAHTPPPGGGDFQSLTDHLRNTARLAEEFARPLGLAAAGRVLGLLHDLGKYSPEFQAYLRACHQAALEGKPVPRGRLDHKGAGALVAAGILDPLAFPIAGHHGGLPSRADLQDIIARARAEGRAARLLAQADEVLSGCQEPEPKDVIARELLGKASSELELELLLRLLYSCLVDADALDTEAHFSPAQAAARTPPASPEALWPAMERSQKKLMAGAPDTPVNRVRRLVYEDCLRAAELPPGVFRLTVPTGGGKTRSSLAFALRHAARHGLQRVVYAIPYTSIIEQTVDVFRGIFADPRHVLEHHSAAASSEDEEVEAWRSLAADNWAAPIIVTTTVQLFESLFAAHPGRCRKVHNLPGSVLILDEAQLLPGHLLAPIVDVLRTLVTRHGMTLVLCTATQPALEGKTPYLEGLPPATEIVTDAAAHFRSLRRVAFSFDTKPCSWGEVASRMLEERQCLAIVNTKKDALALLDGLGQDADLHLSTLLCGAHRRAVLAEVRRRLDAGEPCRLVSTQVVEAGVDLDFPCVLRAYGPLDSIMQAAGRCNREGRLSEGQMEVFDPESGSLPPGAYQTAAAVTRLMLSESSIRLDDPDTFPAYFAQVYANLDTDAKGIQRKRGKFHFPEVESHFHLIDDSAVPVLVGYDRAAVEGLAAAAAAAGRVTAALWQAAQPHTVGVRRRELERLVAGGMVVEVVAGSGLYRWLGGYDRVRGIGGQSVDPADLIV